MNVIEDKQQQHTKWLVQHSERLVKQKRRTQLAAADPCHISPLLRYLPLPLPPLLRGEAKTRQLAKGGGGGQFEQISFSPLFLFSTQVHFLSLKNAECFGFIRD